MATLFDDDTPPTPSKVARAEKKERKDAGLQRVLLAHYARFEERFKFPPVKNFGGHKRMLRPIFESWGEDETDAALALFMKTTDSRVTTGYQPDYTIQHFLRVAQYLRVADARPVVDGRTARNADAVAKAIAGPQRQLGGKKR